MLKLKAFSVLVLLSFFCFSHAESINLKIDGLEMTILAKGSGDKVQTGDKIKVHYKGMFEDGKEFDSSLSREPLEFVLGGGVVIKGWDIGLVGMQKGEKRKLIIQPGLGYGSRDMGIIPPNSVLVFEVELVGYEKGLKPDIFPAPSSIQWETKTAGLKFFDEKVGAGKEVKFGTTLTMHYTGWLLNGNKFASTKDDLKQFSFTIGAGEVIKGWEKGLLGMKEGGVRYLRVEPQLGYANMPLAKIPAHSTLLFKIALTKVQAAVVKEGMDLFPDANTISWQNGVSGLQYFTQKQGQGEISAQEGQTVQVHYTGWLEDGTRFDSSRDRGQPFVFTIGQGQVIRGWEFGVTGMKVGEKRYLKIPSDLGYGKTGSGPIPGNATLLFAVELIAIK